MKCINCTVEFDYSTTSPPIHAARLHYREGILMEEYMFYSESGECAGEVWRREGKCSAFALRCMYNRTAIIHDVTHDRYPLPLSQFHRSMMHFMDGP